MKNTMRILLFIIFSYVLCACSAGNSENAPVTATTDLAPGTYATSTEAATYSTDSLAGYLLSKICLPGTDAADCTKNQDNLFNKFNFKIDQVKALTNTIHAYTMQYSTEGIKKENRLVSGTVLIPELKADAIKGIVLYYHSTAVAKAEVPSCLEGGNLPAYCNFTSLDGKNLSSIIASQGYIVVMPDYIGQGVDNQVIHPYILYPENNALSGIYMLNAARTLLNNQGLLNNQNQSYLASGETPLYVAGFSEGGSYALWATKLLQSDYKKVLESNNYRLADTAALSGAYDLENAQMPMELDNVAEDTANYNILKKDTTTLSKPLLTSFMLSSYGFYSLNHTYSSLMAPEFFSPVFIPPSTTGNIATLFNTSSLSRDFIAGEITADAAKTGYGINGNNSVKAILASGLENDPALIQALKSASLTNFSSLTPINFVYLSKDSVVTNLNSKNAYNGIMSQSAPGLITETVLNNSFDSPAYLYCYNKNSGIKQAIERGKPNSTLSAQLNYNNTKNASNEEAPIDHAQSEPFALIAALFSFNNSKVQAHDGIK